MVFLQIRREHGRERRELEEVRAKYLVLRKRARSYQNHRAKKVEQYERDIHDLRETFASTLLECKENMSGAYQDRERKVQDKVVELKRYLFTPTVLKNL